MSRYGELSDAAIMSAVLEVARQIGRVADAIEASGSIERNFQRIIERLGDMEENIMTKLDDLHAKVAEMEAEVTELTTEVTSQGTQIDEAIVTLQELKAIADSGNGDALQVITGRLGVALDSMRSARAAAAAKRGELDSAEEAADPTPDI